MGTSVTRIGLFATKSIIVTTSFNMAAQCRCISPNAKGSTLGIALHNDDPHGWIVFRLVATPSILRVHATCPSVPSRRPRQHDRGHAKRVDVVSSGFQFHVRHPVLEQVMGRPYSTVRARVLLVFMPFGRRFGVGWSGGQCVDPTTSRGDTTLESVARTWGES
jgi:hypothetical protein